MPDIDIVSKLKTPEEFGNLVVNNNNGTWTVTESQVAPPVPPGSSSRTGMRALTTTVLAEIKLSLGDVLYVPE